MVLHVVIHAILYSIYSVYAAWFRLIVYCAAIFTTMRTGSMCRVVFLSIMDMHTYKIIIYRQIQNEISV